MKDLKISLIGCGKMATALSTGIYNKFPNLKFFGYNRTFSKAKDLMEKLKGKAAEKITDLPPSDIYFLGVKPQQFDEMIEMANSVINQKSLVISIIAGVSNQKISKKLKTKKIIRIMPNTPCLVGEGVISIYFSKGIEEKEKLIIKKLLESVGLVFELSKEEQLNTSTVFTGSGPGFLFEVARILYLKIMKEGIEPEIAKKMIAQTFLGSGKLMSSTDESFEALRNSVASKGGTTEAGLRTLKEQKFQNILEEAIENSLKRCDSLSDFKEKNV
jgi:pyrroline-5-carboxylate reductase